MNLQKATSVLSAILMAILAAHAAAQNSLPDVFDEETPRAAKNDDPNEDDCFKENLSQRNDRARLMAWRKLAVRGDEDAQYCLGMAYMKGKGTPVDYKLAAKWLEKAAENDMAQAQVKLGNISSLCGVENAPCSEAQAVYWWQLAADQGNAEAQYRLAMAYRDSRGVPYDRNKYMELLDLSARQNYPDALYHRGKEYPGYNDPRKIRMWMQAVRLGQKDAAYKLYQFFRLYSQPGSKRKTELVRSYVFLKEYARLSDNYNSAEFESLEREMTPPEIIKAKSMGLKEALY